MKPTSYLRDGWNIIDFIVVLSAIVEFLPIQSSTRSFSGFRALRAFRPLRGINSIPSMKKLVKVLLISIPNLANVVVLLTFIIFLFGILGLHQFVGNAYYRCRLTEEPDYANNIWWIDNSVSSLCTMATNRTCPTGYCGHPGDVGLTLASDNVTSTRFISYGITTFDNIGKSILTVF